MEEDIVPETWFVGLNEETGVTEDTSDYQKNLKGDFVQSEAQLSDLVSAYGGKLERMFIDAAYGMEVTMDEETAASIAENPSVAYVEQVTIFKPTQQFNPTWGIDRIDQRDLPLDGTYNPGANNGTGVTAYIIDTGVRITHDEFENASGQSRAIWGANFAGDNLDTDCDGHGTHVAGTVGGLQYGVAKNVNIVAVKVFDCSGAGAPWSNIIAAIEWVMNHAANNGISDKAVANMSLGGGFIQTVNTAVRNLHNSGVLTAVAAANSNADACGFSPASEPTAITVGSTTNSDVRSSFSNYGPCLDIFAPGSSITSAWISNDSSTAILSGTSMASPHVAGALALFISGNSLDAENDMISTASFGKVNDAQSGSPNLLLYVSEILSGPAPSDSPSISPPPSIFPTPLPSSVPSISNMPSSELFPINIFSNRLPDYCLGQSTTDSWLYLYRCTLPSTVMFFATSQGYIRSAADGKCLEANSSTVEASQPSFKVCNGGIGQIWRIEPDSSGVSTIRPEIHYPNVCLDENSANVNVYQWSCDGSIDQYFKLGPVATMAPSGPKTASPTSFPTSRRTKSPKTASPTSLPTNPPTDPPVATCDDPTLKFKFKKPNGGFNSSFRDCSWVGSSKEKRCGVKANRISCPKTCSKCHVCKDSPLMFKIEKTNKTLKTDCKWVKENKAARCRSAAVVNACRDTCNAC